MEIAVGLLFLVEDKLPPVIECFNDTLPCYIDPLDVDLNIYASATDNCDTSVTLFYTRIIEDFRCTNNEFVSVIRLTWTAIDDQGLRSQCESEIYFERLFPSQTVFPDDTTIYCPETDLFPRLTGKPTIDDFPISDLCDLTVTFSDVIIPAGCDGNYDIDRLWTVTDICTGNSASDRQTIFVRDTLAPLIPQPDSLVIGTEFDSCKALYVVPDLMSTDLCSEDSLIVDSVIINSGNGVFLDSMIVVGDTVVLDTGEYWVTFYAIDDCGNIDSVQQVLTVVDDVVPTLLCINSYTVYVDSLGVGEELCVDDLDAYNLYYDNCGVDTVLIAKMIDFCDTTLSNKFDTCVEFCCEDTGNEVMLVVKVTDLSGNMNFCMIPVEVLDTFPPVITRRPPDTSVSCTIDYRDTTLTGGGLRATDNCGVVFIKYNDVDSISACSSGTVTRIWTACDLMGNMVSDTQEIIITNDFMFHDSLINWAIDTCIENCPLDSLPETIGSVTTVTGDSCDVVMVSYTDSIDSDVSSACLKILRTWTVSTMCDTNFLADSTQTILIKNYRAPNLIGPPDTVSVSSLPDTCGAEINLDPVQGDSCSTGLVIVNSLTTGGPVVSGFFPVGIYDITYTATDACGNVSIFNVVLIITDDAGPALICPSDTLLDCGSSIDTSITGVPIAMDNCQGMSGEIMVVFSDSTIAGGCTNDFVVERTWIATDSSGNTSSCVQTIEIRDTIAPIISCPADVTISCELPSDSGSTGVATATDNCDASGVLIAERDSVEAGRCANEMTIFRIWTAMDSCGNTSECIQTIAILDTTPPTIVCPLDTTVECSENTGENTTGSPTLSDNCDAMGATTYTAQDSIVPGVKDTLRVIYRKFTATDACGNTSTCEQVITVQDTTAPTLICPPDITVGCDTILDSLDIFGIPDTTDNCLGIILTLDTIYDLDLCNAGTITRIFIATDSVGNNSRCEQVITVELTDSLQDQDIIWPDSLVEVDACIGIDPDSLQVGMPRIDSTMAACFRINIEFADSIDYECSPGMGICTTVVRKWTVTDSCQLDTLGNGVFCFTQTINVVDTMPPVMDIVTDPARMGDSVFVYLHPDSACEAFIRINATADDCSGIKLIRNNSQYGVDTFANATGRYPRGLTPLRFIAEDSCCNSDTQRLFIFVLDTIPPSITCRDAMKRILGETGTGVGEAEFCVSELIATAMDNCDPRLQIRASFDPLDPADTCRVYNCDSLMGLRMLMRNLTIYISDGSGNTTTCVSKITVEDEFMVCTGSIVGGVVKNVQGTGIEDASVELMNMGMTEMTDANGAYTFGELWGGTGYTMMVDKPDDPLNGISTKDVILIQRHLLGIDPFEEPWQYIAADLNASNSVEVSDIVRLRRLILGHTQDLKDVPDWYFMDEFKAFEDIEHPLDDMDPYTYKIDTLRAHMNIGILGVKPGDLDGSAKVSSTVSVSTREAPVLKMKCELKQSDADVAFYELSFGEAIDVSGMFLSMDYSDTDLKVQDVEVDTPIEDNVMKRWDNQLGVLRLIWSDPSVALRANDITVRIKVNSGDWGENPWTLKEDGMYSEVIDADLNSYEIVWDVASSQTNERNLGRLVLKQNRPNPFSHETNIEFYSPVDDDDVVLEITGASGNNVYTRRLNVTKGWHNVTVQKDNLGGSGIYYYRLIGHSGMETRRMLIIE